MLQKLHEGIKGWVATVFVVLISLAFVAWGVTSYLGARHSKSAVVVTVGSAKITKGELQSQYITQKNRYEAQKGALPKAYQAILKQQVLDQLVQNALNGQALKKLGLIIPVKTAESALRQVPDFQVNGVYSPTNLKRYLRYSAQTLPGVLAGISEQLSSQQFQIGVNASNFVLPATLANLYHWRDERRTFRYAVMKPSQFLPSKPAAQAQLKAYYKAHAADYRLPERVKLSYLILSPAELRKKIVLPSSVAKNYYQSNLNQFRLPAVYRFALISLPAPDSANPKSVESFVKKSTEITQALSKGKTVESILARFEGSVETKTALELNARMLEILRPMNSGQQLSKQALGDNIIWLQSLSRKAGKMRPFAKVKSMITGRLTDQLVSKKMASMAQRLSELTYTQSTSLEPAAKALGLSVHHTPFFGKTGGKGLIMSDKKVINSAFSDDVLKQRNNSFPFSLSDRSVVVLRVEAHKKASEQSFAEAKAQVKKRYNQQLAALQAGVFAAKLQQMLDHKKEGAVAQLLATRGIAWTHIIGATRQSTAKIPKPVFVLVFGLEQGKAATVALSSAGQSALVVLEKVQSPPARSDLGGDKALRSAAQVMQAKLDYLAVMQSVRDSVPVDKKAV